MQDNPDQYVDDLGPTARNAQEDRMTSKSSPSANVRTRRQPSRLQSSSSASRTALLSPGAAARKRLNQTALLEAVKLLAASIVAIQQLPADLPVTASDSSKNAGSIHQNTADGTPKYAQATSQSPVSSVPAAEQHDARCGNQCKGEPAFAEKLTALQGMCSQQEMKAHVMTACQLVDPSMGYAGITAAISGEHHVEHLRYGGYLSCRQALSLSLYKRHSLLLTKTFGLQPSTASYSALVQSRPDVNAVGN